MHRIAIASMAALSIAGAGCEAPGPPNLIVVSVDTLRADALGVYGARFRRRHSTDSRPRG